MMSHLMATASTSHVNVSQGKALDTRIVMRMTTARIVIVQGTVSMGSSLTIVIGIIGIKGIAVTEGTVKTVVTIGTVTIEIIVMTEEGDVIVVTVTATAKECRNASLLDSSRCSSHI